MVKHTQTFRWQQPTNCLSVFDHFLGLALKSIKICYVDCYFLSKSHILQLLQPTNNIFFQLCPKNSYVFHMFPGKNLWFPSKN